MDEEPGVIRLAPVLPLRSPVRTRPERSDGRSAPSARGRARRAVRTAILAFVGILPPLWFVVESKRPYYTDPSFVQTRAALHAAVARNPVHRLHVVIGSSRVQYGFAPDRLGHRTGGEGKRVMWFNASHHEAGPGMNYVTLRRLLRDGLKPDLVVVELMPAFCVRSEAGFLASHTTWQDTGAAWSALPPGEWAVAAVKRRVVNLRDLWTGLAGRQVSLVPPVGPLGGVAPPRPVSAVDRERRTSGQIDWLGPFLRVPVIHPGADRATRALVALCRDRHIRLVFLLTPESTTFRVAYDPRGRERFEDWVAGFVRDGGVRVIDAREWLRDDEFVDGHHPNENGAVVMTERLAREVGMQD